MTDPGTNISNPEPAPPPPSTPPNNPNTHSNREIYDGGANESTPLISNQPEPINNFQEPGHNRAIPVGKLSGGPNVVNCPHCSRTVMTKIEDCPPSLSSCYESNCSLRCCLCYTFTCFIPFCFGKSKDVIHSCPDCRKVITKYTRFDNCCCCC